MFLQVKPSEPCAQLAMKARVLTLSIHDRIIEILLATQWILLVDDE